MMSCMGILFHSPVETSVQYSTWHLGRHWVNTTWMNIIMYLEDDGPNISEDESVSTYMSF